jgi:hypothetical protein
MNHAIELDPKKLNLTARNCDRFTLKFTSTQLVALYIQAMAAQR